MSNQYPAMMYLVITFVIIMCQLGESALSTRTQQPVITQIYPNCGGLLGGTRLSIYGVNFAQNGLNSVFKVFVGDLECPIIRYYSTDSVITCVTPICSSTKCLATTDFRGHSVLDVNVYVETVETTLGASATYTYDYNYTPFIARMTHTVWATSTAAITGLIATTSTSDVKVQIGGQYADLGDNGDVNPSSFPNGGWDSTTTLYYYPSSDLPAGFANLTMNVQNLLTTSPSQQGPGNAQMYPIDRPTDGSLNRDFTYLNNFASTLSGDIFSVCILPVIASVYPTTGSIAGGTIVTIRGHGFSFTNSTSMIVYAGGRKCTIQSATVNVIQCITSPAVDDDSSNSAAVNAINKIIQGEHFFMNSTRPYGSSGAWFKMWNYLDPNLGRDSSVIASGPLRNGLYFTMWFFNESGSWPITTGIPLQNNYQQYSIEIQADFIVPYTGMYTFYFNADDFGTLYGGSPEHILAYQISWQPNGQFFNVPSQISSPVHLYRGQRYPLRITLTNTGGPDQVDIGLRIAPDYIALSDGSIVLKDSHNASVNNVDHLTPYSVPEQLPEELLRYNAMRKIQSIEFNFFRQYERQVIYIHGRLGTPFYIILQDRVQTTALHMNSTAYQISAALTQAANYISSSIRECNYFNVWSNKISVNSYKITIEFVTDNAAPLTLLQVSIPTSIKRNTTTLSANITRTQLHPMLPSGTFSISTNLSPIVSWLPWVPSLAQLKSALQSISQDIIVDVQQTSSYPIVLFLITFRLPRGNFPEIYINTTNILSGPFTSTVVTKQNGTDKALWFHPIPPWMTEIPLHFANVPSCAPASPSAGPSCPPTMVPSMKPTVMPTISPIKPSHFPVTAPTRPPTTYPSRGPTSSPTLHSSNYPTVPKHTYVPTSNPTTDPHCVTSIVSSTVELYMTTPLGDIIKAACDGSGSSGPGFFGYVKGAEHSCGYSYASNATALIFFTNVTGYFANNTATVSVTGSGFLMGNSSNVSVTVASEPCKINFISDTYITCSVYAVPMGRYKAVVYIPKLGYALYKNHTFLSFSQQIFSFQQEGGSLSGGGLVIISGRGFSYSSNVTISNIEKPCRVTFASPSTIKCIVPAFPESEFKTLFSYLNSNVSSDKYRFEVIVDTNPINYFVIYEYSLTPMIRTLSPPMLSFAISSNVKAVGYGLSGVDFVTIGGSPCKILNSSDTYVLCFLARSNNVTARYTQDVIIHIPGKGYASNFSAPIQIPQLERGFHIVNMSAHVGSLFGGRSIVIEGIGFFESNRSKYNVRLSKLNTPYYIRNYNDILMKLGQQPMFYEYITCFVVNVTTTTISCTLDHSYLSDDASYSVSVTLNNVNSACLDQSVNASLCVFTEKLSLTPQLSHVITKLTQNNSAVMSIYGSNLGRPSGLAVWLNNILCDVNIFTSGHSYINATSPPLSAGIYHIVTLVDGQGYANSSLTVFSPVTITSVITASPNISLGGGSLITIGGAGFYGSSNTSNCQLFNFMQLYVSGLNGYLNASSYIQACSTTEIVLSAPPISLKSILKTKVQSLYYDISFINVTVNGFFATAKIRHIRYHKLYSPLLSSLTPYEGFAGDTITFTVSIAQSSVTSNATVDGVPCTKLLVTSVIRGSVHNFTYVCTIPPIGGGYQPLLVHLWPYGNAVRPASYAIPQFLSQLFITPFSEGFMLPSPAGGQVIALHGRGLSIDMSVLVCGSLCPTVFVDYNYLECTLPMHTSIWAVTNMSTLGIRDDLIQSISVGTYTTRLGTQELVKEARDQDYETYYYDYNANCFIALVMPSGFAVQPFRVRFYPRLQYALDITAVAFEGILLNQKSYVTLGTLQRAHEGWNYIDANTNYSFSWFSSLRYRPLDGWDKTHCMIAEIDFIGIVASLTDNCPINVTSSKYNSGLSAGFINYRGVQESAVVLSISPTNGTALGGTIVTLNGVNLSPIDFPTLEPTLSPTSSFHPRNAPSMAPTFKRTAGAPTLFPSPLPTAKPSSSLSLAPSMAPLLTPTIAPSTFPTTPPSTSPSTLLLANSLTEPNTTTKFHLATHRRLTASNHNPSVTPSVMPSYHPSVGPSSSPSRVPSYIPSTHAPSQRPSTHTPSRRPSIGPSMIPTMYPVFAPTVNLTAGLTVNFSGVLCDVVSSSSTSITCITRPRTPDMIEISSVSVYVEGCGFATVAKSAQFLYIDKWSELTSWQGQEPPQDGDLVYIPEGQVLLLDTETPILTALIIEGALYFDPTRDVTLDASYVFVNGGLLQVGTSEEPYEKNAIITLHGDRYTTIEIPYIGAKCIAVASKGVPMATSDTGIRIPSRNVGELEIHGKKRLRTWTHLAQTANAGDKFIVTSEPVDFAPGETLVIPGTNVAGGSLDLPTFEYEEVTVSANLDGYTIILSVPLQYTHDSEIHYREGKTINMRCEVALLTRNVVIQGDENSYGQLFGVHNVAMMSGIFRVENTEVRHCGQAFNFGRYCTHSHRAGNMEGSYVKANSIHHSFQRAVTTHDTSNWEVRDNVAFDVQGHTYFVEDGTEQYNSFSGNLGILTRRSSALLPSDMKPAVFWTSTPSNFWYDNVGVHSYNFGMWFEFSASVTHTAGDQDPDTCPVHAHLGMHKNNTFHGNVVMGMRIYPEYSPLVDPCDPNSGPAPQDFYTILSYRNGGNGLFVKAHGDLHHHGHIIVENGGDDISIVKYPNVPYYTNYPTFEDTLLIATLNPNNVPFIGKRAIFCPQDEHFMIKNMTIVNYGNSGAIASCNECLSGENMKQGAHTVRFAGMNFVNSTRRIIWTETKKEIFWDLDGTLAGKADHMLTMYRAFNDWSDCERLSVSIFDDTTRCRLIRKFGVDYVIPYQIDFTNLLISSAAGNNSIYFLPLDIYGWVAPLANNHTYTLVWKDSGQSPYQFRFYYSDPAYVAERIQQNRSEEFIIQFSPHRWDYIPYSYDVDYNGITRVSPKSVTRLNDFADSQYVNNTLSVLLSSHKAVPWPGFGKLISVINSQLCPPTGCPVPPPPRIGNQQMWSDKRTWPATTLPQENDPVTINSTQWVVLDISPPKLGCIYVYGKLSFIATPGVNISLWAQCIVVYGSFEILGASNSNYNGTAEIVIWGTKSVSIPPLVGEAIYTGSKVIVVIGSFSAKGQPISRSWTKLGSTALLGSNTIVLNTTVNWEIGSEIILSPTEYFTKNETSILEAPNTLEIALISKIQTLNGVSVITTSNLLKKTHLCHNELGETFCGYVGLLSRTITIRSEDCEGPTTVDYGFGGHFDVVDLSLSPNPSKKYDSGQLNLESVELKNFGKINSDHMAITFSYLLTGLKQFPSIVKNCAFRNNYNFAVYSSGATNLEVVGNVGSGNIGGGVYIDSHSSNVVIANNLIVNVYQLPSVILSLYHWNRPIAAFVSLSASSVVSQNVAAGSVDSGFYLVQEMFVKPQYVSVCLATHGSAYSVDESILLTGRSVWNNEAVGCQVGMTLVTNVGSTIAYTDCAVLSSFKVWRNAYAGFLSTDTQANVLVTMSVVAENHIGMSFNYYKFSQEAFSGVHASKFIAIFEAWMAPCGLNDTSWGKVCRTFSETDPLALQNKCNGVLQGSKYQAVGLMLPQFLNAPRTCALAGRFANCNPPTTIDRLCALPFNNRYGVTVGIQYPEQVIDKVTFAGFSSNCATHQTAAIALNPVQIDQQPSVMISGVNWINMTEGAKFGFNTDQQKGLCSDNPCAGHDFVIMHDFDGSAYQSGSPGQLLFRNPEYTAPAPMCSAADVLGSGFYFCPSNIATPFKQYYAIWHDEGTQILQPIIIKRSFQTENRTFAAFGPRMEECSKRGFFSRYPFTIAEGMINYIQPTGTNPGRWVVRWDAPTSTTAALVYFFITESNVINVFVGQSEDDPNAIHIPELNRYPTLKDRSGANARDPQKRLLAVTMRGGPNRFYEFVQMPQVQVTIRMEMDITQFFSSTFIANLATLLDISASRVKIANVRQGSVIVDFVVLPENITATKNITVITSQVRGLQNLSKSLVAAVTAGTLAKQLNVVILNFTVVPPRVPVKFNPLANTTNYTWYLHSVESKDIVVTEVVNFVPSHYPSGSPLTSAPTLLSLPNQIYTSGLSLAAIAGIAVAVVVMVCIAALFVYFWLVYKGKLAPLNSSWLSYAKVGEGDANLNMGSLYTSNMKTHNINNLVTSKGQRPSRPAGSQILEFPNYGPKRSTKTSRLGSKMTEFTVKEFALLMNSAARKLERNSVPDEKRNSFVPPEISSDEKFYAPLAVTTQAIKRKKLVLKQIIQIRKFKEKFRQESKQENEAQTNLGELHEKKEVQHTEVI